MKSKLQFRGLFDPFYHIKNVMDCKRDYDQKQLFKHSLYLCMYAYDVQRCSINI